MNSIDKIEQAVQAMMTEQYMQGTRDIIFIMEEKINNFNCSYCCSQILKRFIE